MKFIQANARLLRFRLRLDVNQHLGSRHGGLERRLQAIADGMRGGHRHGARHHQVELDERHLARRARLDVMRLDRPFGVGRDHFANAAADLGRHCLVHQAADQLAHQAPAGPEDVERHHSRQRGIQDLPAGHRGQSQADQHAYRGRHIRQQVPAVGYQGWRPLLASPSDQERTPRGVEAGGKPVQHEPNRKIGETARPDQGIVGLVQHQQGGHDDQGALDHRREILGLVVTELMAAIGRLQGDVDGVERDHRGDHVDDALQRVRIEGDAARAPIGQELEAQHGRGHRDRAHCRELEPVGGLVRGPYHSRHMARTARNCSRRALPARRLSKAPPQHPPTPPRPNLMQGRRQIGPGLP